MKNKVLGDLKFFLFLCFWQRGRPTKLFSAKKRLGKIQAYAKQNKTDLQSGHNVYKVAFRFIYEESHYIE